MALSCALLLASALSSAGGAAQTAAQNHTDQLVFPGALKRDELVAGNPLATYAAMLDLDKRYRESPVFASIYPEIKCNFEEFLGFPASGTHAMSLPTLRRSHPGPAKPIPESYVPESALAVIERGAKKTQIVVWGEEHHLPQTRSLFESLLRSLWRQGYRYLAAEAFEDRVMDRDFRYPTYESGYYLMDPVFANAVRTAKSLGYRLVAYDTKERGPADDASFRDRTQAQNVFARIFERDSNAKVLIIAGRGHASEEAASDGWTPMASVLKRITGIDPLSIYAPTMSERTTREEEDPSYRYAVEKGLVAQPTVFVDRSNGSLFGSSSFDAYVFWPRVRIVGGRPDWMIRTMNRKKTDIPSELKKGAGMRLVQAFAVGEPASAVPVDQVVIDDAGEHAALMLPSGKFWLRTIDRHSNVLASAGIAIR